MQGQDHTVCTRSRSAQAQKLSVKDIKKKDGRVGTESDEEERKKQRETKEKERVKKKRKKRKKDHGI